MTKIVYRSGNNVVTLDSAQSYTTVRKKFNEKSFKGKKFQDSFEGYAMIKADDVIAVIEDESLFTKTANTKSVITANGVNFYATTRMSSVVGSFNNKEKHYENGFFEFSGEEGARAIVKVDLVDAITNANSDEETESAE